MTDEPPSSQSDQESWFGKILRSFSPEPRSREELRNVIKEAANNALLDDESLSIIEGALDVANQQVREIMIPRSQMVVVNGNDPVEAFVPKIVESGHSRFPVIGESIDDIQGVLLAKDLLPFLLEGREDFKLSKILRPANIIPESKRLNILLREFREQRYHMAIVIDEYGGVSGLVTIEDILEEIVGEIEDETDDDENDQYIRKINKSEFIIKALTPVEDFNDYFSASISEEEFDTMGGVLVQAFGHLPKRDESTEIGNFQFRVLYADNRQIHLLRLSILDD